MMIRNLLSVYTAAEQACLDADGHIDECAMGALTEAAAAAENALRLALARTDCDDATRVEFGRRWLGFNAGCEPCRDVLAMLACRGPAGELAAAV